MEGTLFLQKDAFERLALPLNDTAHLFAQMFRVSHHILIGLKHKKEDYLVTLLPSPRTVEGSVAEGATNEAGRLFSADLRKMTLLPATIAHNVFPMLAR